MYLYNFFQLLFLILNCYEAYSSNLSAIVLMPVVLDLVDPGLLLQLYLFIYLESGFSNPSNIFNNS